MIDIALNEQNDIFLDGSGNITIIDNDPPFYYAIKQAVIITFRLFLGEYDFDINVGIEWDLAFKGLISQNDFIFDMEEEMLKIPNVVEVTVNLDKLGREALFNIEIILAGGGVVNVDI